MSREYSENVLVQNSAGNLLQNVLGWEVVLAYNSEKLGPDGTLGRTSYGEVLLTRYFRQALLRLNPWLTPNQLDEVQKKFTAHVSTASLMQINEEKYFLLRDGIPVTVKRPGMAAPKIRSAAVIDFKNPENNHFLAVKEMKIHSQLYRCRTDIVGFVNGIPLLFIELKKPTVDVQNAYIDNYRNYLDTIPQLFYYNAFLMLSNGLEAKVGTLGSKYEFFHEWKRLKESDAGRVELETMLRGICEKKTFLDLLENFILYDHSGGRTTKILARNHQYLGVNEAVSAYENRKLKDGRLGVFWHTQGSGKSYSMVFLAQKIRRKFAGSPTIVVLTDRDELNRQISDTFENCGLLGKTKASQFIASSGIDLVKKLQGNPSFVFTLIQKFNLPKEPPIYPDHDILILSDEAHRSQYGIFADNMMHLRPRHPASALPVRRFWQMTISPSAPLAGICRCMTSSGRWRTAQRCRCIMKTVRIRSPSWTSRRSPGGSWMPLKQPTLILRRRKSWNASLQRRSIFSPQTNGCVPLQRTLWSITLTFGPAARRCSSA